MKGTVFAVALNHRSQLDAWREAFSQPPYNAPPKTAVWFIKPRNTVIRHGEPIPYPQGEKVLSGATVALIVGKTASRIRPEVAADYIAGYALANEVSLPEESFYRPAIKAKCRDGFCPLGEMAPLSDVDNLTIITEINGREADHWNTADLQRSAAQLLSALSEFATLNPGDAILLGTPQNRVALRPGDRVRILAKGLPALENPVVAEDEFARHQTFTWRCQRRERYCAGVELRRSRQRAGIYAAERAAGIYQSAKHLYRTSPNVGAPEQRRIYALRSRTGRGDWQNGA